jgi:eukaryotic-like serine/threonine-protein kinase
MFRSATQEDPQFALAYSRLAETDSTLGYDSEAEQSSRKALELSGHLPLAEKYLIEAIEARVMKDNKKAIEIYEKLAAMLPGDTDVQFSLGELYVDKSEYNKARAEYAKVLQNDPNNLEALLQTGWLEVASGNPQAGLEPLNSALSLSIEVDNQEQKAVILQALGIGYEGLNKYEEATRSIQQSMEINKKLDKKVGVANNLVELGNIMAATGKPDQALANYNQALNLRREIGAKKDAADTLLSIGGLLEDRGQYDEALEIYNESLQAQRDSGDVFMQAVCLNDIGSVYLAKGQNEDAITYYQRALELRVRLNNPADTTDTLHNLAEVYTKTAQYDQAISSFMGALQLRHATNDANGAALESHSIGELFLIQGRFGAAVNSLSESVKSLRDANDHSRLMVQVLIDYADALARSGRSAEVGKTLEEAQSLATELKNDKLIADVHNTQGDIAFYRGDTKAARGQYQLALQMAQHAKEAETVFVSKLNLARVAIAEGRSSSVISELRTISQDADRQGMKYLALVSSVDLATAMVNSKDYTNARQELDRALGTSEKMGTSLQTATIHFLLGNLAEQTSDATGASRHYRQAVAILDEIKKEPGAEKVLQRVDLKSMYGHATRGSAAG